MTRWNQTPRPNYWQTRYLYSWPFSKHRFQHTRNLLP